MNMSGDEEVDLLKITGSTVKVRTKHVRLRTGPNKLYCALEVSTIVLWLTLT